MPGLRRAGGLRHAQRRGELLVPRSASSLAYPGGRRERPLLLQRLPAKNDRGTIEGQTRMIVIERNGKTTVITGWQAWLLGAAAFAVTTVVLAFVFFVLLGVAITVGAVLLIVVPVVVGIALLASLFQRPSGR
jgi:hypothetical protein